MGLRMVAGAAPWLVLIWGGAGAATWLGRTPFAVTTQGWLILAALGLAVATPFGLLARTRPRFAQWSAGVAVFLLLAMALTPQRWTIFEADASLTPGWLGVGVTLTIAVLVWLAARRWQTAVTRAGTMAALGAACLLALGGAATPSRSVPPTPAGSDKPNIYQFVFDGMRSDMFDPARDGAAFAGFTSYPANRANYVATDASLPSMFSGRFFEGGSFRAFQNQARAGGYRTALAKAGYHVSLYTPDRNRFWWLDAVHTPVTAQDLRRAKHDPQGWKTLLQTGLIEAAPPGLKRPVLELSRLWSRWAVYNSYKQELGLLDRFLADEAKRPARGQYVYFHIMIPHPGYHYDANCQRTKSTYTGQAGCVRMMMKRITAALAAQGKLENALVIFQGDHGFHADESNLPPTREAIPPAIRAKFLAIGDSFKPDALLQRTRAMMLVHRPNGSGAMRVSNEASELIDVAPTVAAVAGLSSNGMIGRSLLADNRAPRDFHLFAGVTSKTGLFRERLGRDTDRGRIAHVSIAPDGRWTLHPDVIANGDGTISGR